MEYYNGYDNIDEYYEDLEWWEICDYDPADEDNYYSYDPDDEEDEYDDETPF
jgi:hypothetical protein